MKEKGQKNKIVDWLKVKDGGLNGSGADGKGTNGNGVEGSKGAIAVSSPHPYMPRGKKRAREEDDSGSYAGRKYGDDDSDEVEVVHSRTMVVCPVCLDKVWESSINHHLDNEHGL